MRRYALLTWLLSAMAATAPCALLAKEVERERNANLRSTTPTLRRADEAKALSEPSARPRARVRYTFAPPKRPAQ
jgi:hypothetical protein